MNFTESCESVSELSYVIFPYLFKRPNESNNFSQVQAERISTSSKTLNPGLRSEVLTSIAQLVFRDRLDRAQAKYAGDSDCSGKLREK